MNLGWEPIWRERGAQWELEKPDRRVLELVRLLREEGRTRVHDLGCGLGRHLLLLAAEGFEAYGSDISPTALDTCQRRLQEAGLSATLTRSEMAAIPHRDNSFDAVIAWNVLYHALIEDILTAIRGVRDELKEGGYLLTTFISAADGQCALSQKLLAEGRAEELEPGTYVIPEDSVTDKALIHHYSTEPEIRERFLEGFDVVWLEERRTGGADFEGSGYRSARWVTLARKRG